MYFANVFLSVLYVDAIVNNIKVFYFLFFFLLLPVYRNTIYFHILTHTTTLLNSLVF